MEPIKVGATSVILEVFIQTSTATDGSGMTGLAHNSSGLTAYYCKDVGTAATSISLVDMTLGTFTSGGFKQIDATNMPGWYQFCPPNAALSTGKRVAFLLKGVTAMAPCAKLCRLVSYDPDDADDLGLTALTSNRIKKNTALSNFEFLMIDAADHITPKTGLTITATRSIDGAAFGSCANSATEVSGGIYKINFADTDLNGNIITFKFAASGADDRFITIVTQP